MPSYNVDAAKALLGCCCCCCCPPSLSPKLLPKAGADFSAPLALAVEATKYIAAARRTAEQPRPLLLILLRTRRRHGLPEDALHRLCRKYVAVGAPTAEQRAAPSVEGWKHSSGVVSERTGATRGGLRTLLLRRVPKKAPPAAGWLCCVFPKNPPVAGWAYCWPPPNSPVLAPCVFVFVPNRLPPALGVLFVFVLPLPKSDSTGWDVLGCPKMDGSRSIERR
ncbi:hypothetical protein B0H14DRAFT_3601071 [Mycena olivaceomarginata]|nr:hypothetical protein B0H14DRAFT_3601071 [Mycena olivaceomarginata]